MNVKTFYEAHRNFSKRTRTDYFIAPGIKSKFDLIIDRVKKAGFIKGAVDLGCSGDSILCFIKNIRCKSFLDIVNEPLVQFKNNQKEMKKNNNQFPLCGDIQKLPYRKNTFEIIFALDVLEHVENDFSAVAEISRILKKKGFAVISVPHRKKYYSLQDKLIGHYRRYEIDEIKELFNRYNLRCMENFGIYGTLMKISFFQAIKPDFTEASIIKLRRKYDSNFTFRLIWNIFVKLISKLMKLDARYTPLKYSMNMAFIFMKSE
jgi:ubiquinone/menaquinone biosynthesis C-methylase UbiE